MRKIRSFFPQNGVNQKRSTSKESQEANPTATSPTSSAAPSAMINSSDSLLYNLSYLSSVIHPVIILRLLEHRLFTPLFKKKSVTSNPPAPAQPINPIQINEPKGPNSILTPLIGTSALASIPTLPKPDPFKRQRSSLTKDNLTTNNEKSSLITKFAHSTYEKNRKINKTNLSTSPSGLTSINSQLASTNNNLSNSNASSGGGTTTSPNDLSLLLSFTSPISSGVSPSTTSTSTSIVPLSSPGAALTTGTANVSSSIGNSSNTSTSSSRKWFWKSSDKANQSNLPNDRNPLLQAIVENDTLTSNNTLPSSGNTTNTVAGVGEIKMLEKELLNLPTFQLSDSQNPLLPSPTCLNYDFSSQFEHPSPLSSTIAVNRQHSGSSSSSNAFKSKYHDDRK